MPDFVAHVIRFLASSLFDSILSQTHSLLYSQMTDGSAWEATKTKASEVWTSICTSNSRPTHFDIFYKLYIDDGGSPLTACLGSSLFSILFHFSNQYRPGSHARDNRIANSVALNYSKVIGTLESPFLADQPPINCYLFSTSSALKGSVGSLYIYFHCSIYSMFSCRFGRSAKRPEQRSE